MAGAVHLWERPDGRRQLFFEDCGLEEYGPLSETISGACLAELSRDDAVAYTALTMAGFAESRREYEYEIPVARLAAAVPGGVDLVPGDRTELKPLLELDGALRDDVPGTRGWRADEEWFREENYDSPDFDPQTYLVALDGSRYVGLVRIWVGSRPRPRLGLIGVLPEYRSRGLAIALIARAFSALADRGVECVTAEVDVLNHASNRLMHRLGATVIGGSVELSRN